MPGGLYTLKFYLGSRHSTAYDGNQTVEATIDEQVIGTWKLVTFTPFTLGDSGVPCHGWWIPHIEIPWYDHWRSHRIRLRNQYRDHRQPHREPGLRRAGNWSRCIRGRIHTLRDGRPDCICHRRRLARADSRPSVRPAVPSPPDSYRCGCGCQSVQTLARRGRSSR